MKYDWVDPRPWVPLNAPLKGKPEARAPNVITEVVAQFDVTHQIRYQPTAKDTFCSTFSWDVTRALGCEIPHWVDSNNKPAKPGGSGKELNVNRTLDWLDTEGIDVGWMKVAELEARLRTKAGYPTVGLWKNSMGHGHIAVLVPPRAGAVDATFIAQAGLHCFAYGLLSLGFGTKPVTFFTHS